MDVLVHQEYIDEGHYTASRGHRNRYSHEETHASQAQPPYQELTPEQNAKVLRLIKKAYENEIITVSMEEDPTLVFETVKRYMSLADTSDFLRLEALGSAVSNLAYAA